ncbi:polyamine-transporting ATPase [Halogeometricum pallidum JCM 14848]|uniref:Molybdate/tungstate import ATP-binding protein WtpC n=1 Tax=Halogeometricum pallidum JCM 14848 TaxID=1227487 RepID=M0DGE8_HALPD|nr:ABC transporter ATP-binding protein [Halogeometricum pallidum]ELZ34515.1 polyamine-transporting ATPase [Halogeometricum pallidum JCM 14848]
MREEPTTTNREETRRNRDEGVNADTDPGADSLSDTDAESERAESAASAADPNLTDGGAAVGAHEDPAVVPETAATDDDSEADAVLELEGVVKRYGSETAVSGLDLTVREGELVTLLGPSGCGKTTTLRMIAGLETATEGTIAVGGDVVDDGGTPTPPEDRDVGLVFQEFALFPHLSVAENVAFGLDDPDSAEAERRTSDLLELVGLGDYGDRSPADLSGGQRQRVALARSLAPEPDVLLLDEPFSNLDVSLRVRMREEVKRILEEAGVTAVSVTHDQEEALSISDRVAVVNDGRVEQVGSPGEVFENPTSRFVASFLGQASFLPATVTDEAVETAVGSYHRDLLTGLGDGYAGSSVDVLVRPDDLRATPTAEGDADGTVVRRQYTGPSFVYHVRLNDGTVVRCLHNHTEEFDVGEPVAVTLVADHALAWYPSQ